MVEVRRTVYNQTIYDYSSSEEGSWDNTSITEADVQTELLPTDPKILSGNCGSRTRRPSSASVLSERSSGSSEEQQSEEIYQVAETQIKGKAISHKAG